MVKLCIDLVHFSYLWLWIEVRDPNIRTEWSLFIIMNSSASFSIH